MHDTTRDRLTALAAVVAALVPAFPVVAEWLQFALVLQEQYSVTFRIVMVVGIVAAALVTVRALRGRDRVLLVFALAALTYSVASLVPSAVWGLRSVLFIVSWVLLFVFGLLLVVRTRTRTATGTRTGTAVSSTAVSSTAGAASGRFHRVTAWAVLVGAAVWLAWTVVQPVLFTLWIPPQDALTAVFAVPQAALLVACIGAVLVFVPPLVRPVRDGARRLWETADVR